MSRFGLGRSEYGLAGWSDGRRRWPTRDAELRSELGNYWTAPPQTPKRKQRVEYEFGDSSSGDEERSVDKTGQPMAIQPKLQTYNPE